MKTFAFIVVLSITALTVQPPAYATATASGTISEVTCTQVTNAGTIVSTPSFSDGYSVVGPIGQLNYGLSDLRFASTCFASHLAQAKACGIEGLSCVRCRYPNESSATV
jgi:hypothetical protein